MITASKRLKRNKTMTLVDEFYLDLENVPTKKSTFIMYLQRSLSGTLLSTCDVCVYF
jgi:hypothetical protein